MWAVTSQNRLPHWSCPDSWRLHIISTCTAYGQSYSRRQYGSRGRCGWEIQGKFNVKFKKWKMGNLKQPTQQDVINWVSRAWRESWLPVEILGVWDLKCSSWLSRCVIKSLYIYSRYQQKWCIRQRQRRWHRRWLCWCRGLWRYWSL